MVSCILSDYKIGEVGSYNVYCIEMDNHVSRLSTKGCREFINEMLKDSLLKHRTYSFSRDPLAFKTVFNDIYTLYYFWVFQDDRCFVLEHSCYSTPRREDVMKIINRIKKEW